MFSSIVLADACVLVLICTVLANDRVLVFSSIVLADACVLVLICTVLANDRVLVFSCIVLYLQMFVYLYICSCLVHADAHVLVFTV